MYGGNPASKNASNSGRDWVTLQKAWVTMPNPVSSGYWNHILKGLITPKNRSADGLSHLIFCQSETSKQILQSNPPQMANCIIKGPFYGPVAQRESTALARQRLRYRNSSGPPTSSFAIVNGSNSASK